MNKRVIVRIAIVIGVIALFAVLALVLRRGGNPSDAQPTPTTSDEPAPTASVSLPGPLSYAAPAADWQSFSSTSLGFSVRYPKDWVSASCGDGCIAFALASESDALITGVSVSPGTLADLVDQAAPYALASESVTLNGITWLRLTLQQPQTGNIFTSHFAERDGEVYEVGINTTEQSLLDRYASILRSFSFLKK